MPDPSKNDDSKLNVTSIIITIITVIGALVTGYFGYKTAYNNIWIPIITTQTAEARLAGQIVSTSIISLPTETLTELLPTQYVVNTDIPSAPTPSPVMWDVFSTDGTSFAAFPYEGCPNIAVNDLGFFASNCNLIFGKGDIKQRGVYGLSMPIQRNVTIQVSVIVRNLIEGEFWIGFSNGISPQSGSLIYAIPPDPGGVDVYLNTISSRNARYSWAPMGQDIGWESGQPQQYNFTIKLVGNNVSAAVNSTTFAAVVASSTDRLFLGYRSKPEGVGTYVDVTISGLTITASP